MIRRAAAVTLLVLLAVLCVLPSAAPAEDGVKTIRVGWYDTPFNHKDSFGRRTGYAYEYQRKIAAYTGWKYQYVEGNWSELLQMLEDGRIDMLSDVSYTEERAEYMYFTDMPMGSELYYLYIAPDSDGITAGDFASTVSSPDTPPPALPTAVQNVPSQPVTLPMPVARRPKIRMTGPAAAAMAAKRIMPRRWD